MPEAHAALIYLIPPNFPKHVHIYARRLERLREKGVAGRLVSFVRDDEYLKQADVLTQVGQRWGVDLHVVPTPVAVSDAVVRFLETRIRRGEPTVVQVLKQDVRPLAKLRHLATRRKVPFGLIVELEGDVALETLYLKTHALPDGPYWSPDDVLASEYEALVHRDRENLECADLVIVMSDEHADLWRHRGSDGEFIVQPPYFDPAQKFSVEGRHDLRARWQVRDAVVVGYSGGVKYAWQRFPEIVRLVKREVEKGTEAFLAAFVLAEDRAIAQQVLAEERMTERTILLTVSPDELGAHLSACDVAIFPRHLHPMNLIVPSAKLGEYLVAGLPLVTTGAHALYSRFLREHGAAMVVDDSLQWSPERDAEWRQLVARGSDLEWRQQLSRSLVRDLYDRSNPYLAYAEKVKHLLSAVRPWPASKSMIERGIDGEAHRYYQKSLSQIVPLTIVRLDETGSSRKRTCDRTPHTGRPNGFNEIWVDAVNASGATDDVRHSTDKAKETIGASSFAQFVRGASPAGYITFAYGSDVLPVSTLSQLQQTLATSNEAVNVVRWEWIDGRRDGRSDDAIQLGSLAVRHYLRHCGSLPLCAVSIPCGLLNKYGQFGASMSSEMTIWECLGRIARMAVPIRVVPSLVTIAGYPQVDSCEHALARFYEGIRILQATHDTDPYITEEEDKYGPCPCSMVRHKRQWASDCAATALCCGFGDAALEIIHATPLGLDDSASWSEAVVRRCVTEYQQRGDVERLESNLAEWLRVLTVWLGHSESRLVAASLISQFFRLQAQSGTLDKTSSKALGTTGQPLGGFLQAAIHRVRQIVRKTLSADIQN